MGRTVQSECAWRSCAGPVLTEGYSSSSRKQVVMAARLAV